MNTTQQRVHRTVTVAALLVGPLSLIVATILQWLVTPAGPSSTIFDMISDNSTTWSAVGLISVFGPLCWLAGIPAVIDLVHGRGWTLTTIGGYLTAAGLAAAVGHLAIYFALYGTAASSGLHADALKALETASSDNLLSNLLLFLFLACFSVGPILLTVGLRMAKQVAVWVPVAAIVMTVANFVGGVPAGIVQLCALVLTFAPMIVAVLRTNRAPQGRGAFDTTARLVTP
jgi:hypothetical protein